MALLMVLALTMETAIGQAIGLPILAMMLKHLPFGTLFSAEERWLMEAKNLRHHKIIVDQWGISQLKVSMFQGKRVFKRKSKRNLPVLKAS